MRDELSDLGTAGRTGCALALSEQGDMPAAPHWPTVASTTQCGSSSCSDPSCDLLGWVVTVQMVTLTLAIGAPAEAAAAEPFTFVVVGDVQTDGDDGSINADQKFKRCLASFFEQ